MNREFPHLWQQSPQYERLWPPSANHWPLCAPQRWIFPALAAVSAHPLRQLLRPAVSDQRQLLDRLSCEHHFESRPAQVTAGTESEPDSLSKTSCKRSLETAAASSICRASSFAATSVARSGPLNVLPSFLRRARQPFASFCTAIASQNKCK